MLLLLIYVVSFREVTAFVQVKLNGPMAFTCG